MRTGVRLALRLSLRGSMSWAVVMAAFAAATVTGWAAAMPTAASRKAFAAQIGGSAAFSALAGPPRALDTPGGYLTWRSPDSRGPESLRGAARRRRGRRPRRRRRVCEA